MSDPKAQRSLEVLWTKHEAIDKLMTERREADQRALRLQAQEYERRLEALNHAHTQAVERNASYVPREVFDVQIAELRKIVYIGMGVLLGLQGVLWFVTTLFRGQK